MNAVLAQPFNRSAWLADRRTGIGGSDVAAILGMSQWSTPLDVYLEKIGEADEKPDNDQMFWGRTLEPVIRQRYVDLTGNSVETLSGIVRHPSQQHMIATCDGLIRDPQDPAATDPIGILEAKTARTADGWGMEWTDEIPEAYALQVQHYMLVTNTPMAHVAVLIGGSDFRIYELRADPDIHEALICAEWDFWKRVIERNPPEPRTSSEAVRMFGKMSAPGRVEATPEVVEAVTRLKDVREILKAQGEIEDQCKTVILKHLGDTGDILTSGGTVLVTWKLAKAPERLDTIALKAAHPAIAAAFTRSGQPSRRLLIK